MQKKNPVVARKSRTADNDKKPVQRAVVSSGNYTRPKGELNSGIKSPNFEQEGGLTVPEIIGRVLKGIPVNLARRGEAVYNDDIFVPNPKSLDLVDVDDMRHDLNEKKKAYADKVAREQAAAKLAAEEKAKQTAGGKTDPSVAPEQQS